MDFPFYLFTFRSISSDSTTLTPVTLSGYKKTIKTLLGHRWKNTIKCCMPLWAKSYDESLEYSKCSVPQCKNNFWIHKRLHRASEFFLECLTDFKRFQMIANDFNWSQMISNDWLQMIDGRYELWTKAIIHISNM